MIGDDPLHYRIAAVLFGAASLVALNRFFGRLRRDRVVSDTPMVRIRSAAQGYVKVTGRARASGPTAISSPLSARPCVWWKYELADEEVDSRGNAHWRTVETGASVEPFVLNDGDAQCLVGPVNAEITPTTHDVWFGTCPRPEAPPSAPSLSGRHKSWRYTEWLLSVGDSLSVMGELRSHSGEGDFNDAVAAKLRQWKLDQANLLKRFDANHDGRIDADEWELARVAAATELEKESPNTALSRISVISQPLGAEPFLIAPLTPARLERREKLFAMAYFVLGLCGVILCAWSIRISYMMEGTII
jgi:hypothetical protein